MLFEQEFSILKDLKTEGTFDIYGFGTLDYLDWEDNNMDFTAETRKIIWHNIGLENFLFQADVRGTTVFVPSIEAIVARGLLTASAELNFGNNVSNQTFTFEVSVKDADCNQFFCNLLSRQQNVITQGKLDAEMQLLGNMYDSASIVGVGKISIEHSDIFKIPLFSGFFQYIGNIIPGIQSLFQESSLEAKFNVADNKFLFRELRVNGDLFSLRASGDVSFNGKLNFHVQLTLLKKETLVGTIVQFVLTPISKALELKLEGSIDEPLWRPIFIPRELMSRRESAISE